MKRVVITGIGIISSIGHNKMEVLASLQTGKSGIVYDKEYAEFGFRSHVCGAINLPTDELIDRKFQRFMGSASAFSYLAMKEAIVDARLGDDEITHPRVGLIAGSGGSSNANVVDAVDLMRDRGAKKVSPTVVPKVMASTVSACLSVAYKIRGVNYSISSACATSAHCIGNAYELIQLGKQDIIFAGGGEEIHWVDSLFFDAMGALSSNYNDTPEVASRPYDKDRDGFVISGGGGILVMEELEHAVARGAKIYAEVIGYGATSDGFDMVRPSGDGAINCMKLAISESTAPVDYINTHGTGTLIGDIVELEAIRTIFGDNIPYISSTKSLTGHGLGAAGVNEAIYTLLMMEHNFIAASANIHNLDPKANGFPIVEKCMVDKEVHISLSNSFGFGGTNASLLFKKY